MMVRIRPLLTMLLLFGSVALIGPGKQTAAFNPLTSFSGYAQIDSPIQLELLLSPTVSSPGETLQLDIRLTNQTPDMAAPEVELQLPGIIALDAATLPAGTSINLQTNGLNWLPIVTADGGVRELSIPLRVESAVVDEPQQVITAVLRVGADEWAASIDVWIGLPPRVEQILAPPQVAIGQPVQLSVDVSGSGPISFVWDLGDGRQVDVAEPVVVFPAAGIYDVSVVVSNPIATATRDLTLTIVPHPAARFVPDDDTPGVGQMVTFIDESGGQPPLTYFWQFGDGATAEVASPSHQYVAPGAYQVHLALENQYGQSDAFWQVTVGVPPTADMVIPDSAESGVPIAGQAFGDDSVRRFRWDMGNGRTYEGERVNHTYLKSGDYYIVMSANNDFGATEVGRWIHVDPGILANFLPLIVQSNSAGNRISATRPDDPLGADLEPVELDQPFVLQPAELPPSMSEAERLFYYINATRAFFQLPPLNQVTELSGAAQQHTDDMAAYAYTAHQGSDGSLPVERLLTFGYGAGYAGEATAWGFQYPYQAVEFWVNSPAHRRIILNRYATDVGVAYTVDYTAPNVWYWTAEFGNAYTAPMQPIIRLQTPESGAEALITEALSYRWNWPVPLGADQRFVVYLVHEGTAVPVGEVTQPVLGSRYELTVAGYDFVTDAADYQWQVRLEDGTGNSLAASEPRLLVLAPDPSLLAPTPTVAPTTPTVITPTPTVPVPTPTPNRPAPTPGPSVPTPPVLVTATPVPTPQP